VIRLSAATVLLQWATGGLLFLWVTTRRREVGIGYGWLMRAVFGVLAAGSVFVGRWVDPVAVRDASAALVVVATAVALAVSVLRRREGVAGERARRERTAARVPVAAGRSRRATAAEPEGREFPPALDLVLKLRRAGAPATP